MSTLWYVMRSKRNKEEFLNQQLQSRNIETYYPYLNVDPVNPRSRKKRPYFPGYLFLRTDIESLGDSIFKWTPGSLGLVGFGGEPAFISEHVLNMIRSQVQQVNKLEMNPEMRFKSGDLVEIQSGPFAGYRAIFDCRISGKERVRVLLEMLQDRQLGVEISATSIEKLS